MSELHGFDAEACPPHNDSGDILRNKLNGPFIHSMCCMLWIGVFFLFCWIGLSDDEKWQGQMKFFDTVHGLQELEMALFVSNP